MTGDQLQQMESLAKRRTAVQQLLNSDGWKMYAAAIQASIDISARQMIETSVAHDAAKYMGSHYALKSMLDWPMREMNSINQQAAMLEEEAIRDAKRGGK